MLRRPSQRANGSTLLEAKKRSSLAMRKGSNNDMQRSARIRVRMLANGRRAPADVRPLDVRDQDFKLMQSCQPPIPVFGLMSPTVEYNLRRAAYAVIIGPSGRIAVVKGKSGYFLPGGGSLAAETPEQTLQCEAREELAADVRIIRRIGEAVQYFYADEQHYRMEAVFFEAEFIREGSGGGEHELCWLGREEIERGLYHQSHAWASCQV